jgi:tRNA uridine 5-carboxymethylaminomethyl modification enzyme
VKYAGYLEREARAVEKARSMESRRIPDAFRYQDVAGLRTEAREKLARLRPSSLGQAARISGVSPADLTIIAVALRR